jgi:hypothetical protein
VGQKRGRETDELAEDNAPKKKVGTACVACNYDVISRLRRHCRLLLAADGRFVDLGCSQHWHMQKAL